MGSALIGKSFELYLCLYKTSGQPHTKNSNIHSLGGGRDGESSDKRDDKKGRCRKVILD
jgi:hypothetical protein